MTIREFFLDAGSFVLPRTPAGALKAYEAGFCPVEAFVYRSTSAKPIDEEPYNFEEIDRILARPNLDFRTNMVLMGIFEKLIHHGDQEIALWAAESINVLENRYNERVAALRKRLNAGEEIAACNSELGRIHFELALLSGRRPAIKEFHIGQATGFYRDLAALRPLDGTERNTYVRALMEARDYIEAAWLLAQDGTRSIGAEEILLAAEIEYSQKRFDHAMRIISGLVEHLDELDERELAVYAYWMGA